MPEIKNTFLKSKMNKDLDARIIPSGEYRDGKNISISASEGADVGALENIRGNFDLTDFGLTDKNLEVIGTTVDEARNRIYFFITNFSDASTDGTTLGAINSTTDTTNDGVFTIVGPKHCIAYCQIPFEEDANISSNTIISEVLVEGAFLNFSKTHPVSSNILENFLFFTDDRNQPRKINIETAISNPRTYYTHEDHISVAKFAPFNPISFLNDTVNPSRNTLLNEKDYWMPAMFLSPGKVFKDSSNNTSFLIFDHRNEYGSPEGRYGSPAQHFGSGNGKPDFDIRVYRVNDENKRFAYIKRNTSDSITISAAQQRVNVKLYGSYDTINGQVSGPAITDIAATLGWDNGTFAFEIRNPQYNNQFSGDADFLKEKFVKFSYRFKYDDDEYSLLAPFSQHAFVPKQYGYFIGDDDNKTKESSVVDFMENQITTAGLVIDLPYTVNTIEDNLKVKEIQLIYKASDEKSLKVIADMKIDDIPAVPNAFNVIESQGGYTAGSTVNTSGGSGTGLRLNIDTVNSSNEITSVSLSDPGTGYRIGDIVTIDPISSGNRPARIQITQVSNKFVYNYASQKPIKVLDEQEIIRVNDIVPMRAKTQEVVGNRVVYGNFLQNKSTPISLNYEVFSAEKSGDNKKEFLNHTLKQGRTYQVGLVLQDRYGRSSNVIVNNNPLARTLNSTFFSDYTNGGVDPLRWPGNCLKVSFSQEIPTQATSTYNGIYSSANPLGWYTYKVVVKQQDQDYYNIYTPGGLSGNINFEKLDTALTFTETSSVFQIPLINDNINKIPRDLKQVGPTDNIFSSSISLFPRVSNTVSQTDNTVTFPNDSNPSSNDINEQSINTQQSTVDTVKDFVDFGEWTAYKNINVRFVESTTTSDDAGSVKVTGPYVPTDQDYTPAQLVGQYPFYIYPGSRGDVDPVFLKNNKNPLIATISTKKRLGFNQANQIAHRFAKDLCVFETKPFKSNLEIYYETSNTGLISQFNSSVNLPTGASGEPVDISNFVATFREHINFPQDISNVFQAVDRNGTPITNSEPSITMRVIRQVPPYKDVTPFFNLDIVQQASFNTPPTYKISTARDFIYNIPSFQKDKFNFIFSLRSNTSTNVNTVVKSVNLTNITPSILTANSPVFAVKRSGNSSEFIINSGQDSGNNRYGGLEFVDENRLEYRFKAYNDTEINSIITNSNFNNFTITNPDSSGNPIQGVTELTARVLPQTRLAVIGSGSERHNNLIVLRVLHSNNGSAIMPNTLNNSNRNNNVPTAVLGNNPDLPVRDSTYRNAILNSPEDRLKGVSYSLHSVRRGIVNYNIANGDFKFFKSNPNNPELPGGDVTSINDLTDKTRDFYCDSEFGQVYYRPGGDGQGSVKNYLEQRDMPYILSYIPYPAWGFIIKLQISDTGGFTHAGAKTSFANFIWIVTKMTPAVPKKEYF